ncbi:MAG TPA: hypothetical protein GXZ30_02405 [Propionibacterium sp.]|nr:hypothetical protein [Propionibacterium sp.]
MKTYETVVPAGEEHASPRRERPEFAAVREAPSAEAWVERYAAWARLVSERVYPLLGPLVRAGSARDASAAEFLTTIEDEQRLDSTRAMTAFRDAFGLPAGATLERAIEICRTLNSPALYARLISQCAWTPQDYQEWIAGELRAAFLQVNPAA